MNKKLGNEIKWLRKKLGISQKELAKGICHQSEISRIEAGEVYPRIDVLHKISLRLRVTIQHFLSLSNDRTDYFDETIKYLMSLNRLFKYKDIYDLTNSELNYRIKKDNYYFFTFLVWQNTVAKFKLGILNYTEIIEILLQLINDDQSFILDDFLDLKIINSIATIYAESCCYNDAIIFYKQILDTDVKSEKFPIFKAKVINNYSKCLYILGRYHESIKISKAGIKICKEEYNMEIIGYLYERLAESQEKLLDEFPEKEIAKNYYKAIFYLQVLNVQPYIIKIKKSKKRFLELITINDLFNTDEISATDYQHA
ncbi:hypothetical protein AF332_26090 [Sporosarcina globispora]|uniref:HTH cro/C1-type domain-containing protein n=1 Tax=Sporosarcina globispora TaxID=1459 RepID=A0A0M0GJN2_SPOGL|nr:helix-turn-helix domain-containing protein [Sporosarcina globispora]KON86557.1 hypothetical protein AF332_06785 [Sporosarcina globispora]KON89953.1 hypothetical protein AF332_26090 [Sporosarcina globispora]